MRFALISLCLLISFAGCRKKTSPEFFKLESAQSVLISRDGDDAYVSPEMDAIIEGLSAIPENAREKERAVELVQRLSSEKARVVAERAPKPPPPPRPDPFAGRNLNPTPVEPPPVVEEEPVDAGPPSEPWTGMDEATFKKLFGQCFSPGPKTELPNGTPATTQVLVSKPECQKSLGARGATTSYLFVDGGVWGKVTETFVKLDAGQPPAPPPPPPPPPPAPRDAGEPTIRLPGAPAPDGTAPAAPPSGY